MSELPPPSPRGPPMAKKLKAPAHLAMATRRWWSAVTADFDLEDHHVRLLTLAAGAWDRAEQARETIATEGAFYSNRHGEPRAHPACAVERDSRVLFARLLRELDLDGVPPPDARPPRMHGGRR